MEAVTFSCSPGARHRGGGCLKHGKKSPQGDVFSLTLGGSLTDSTDSTAHESMNPQNNQTNFGAEPTTAVSSNLPCHPTLAIFFTGIRAAHLFHPAIDKQRDEVFRIKPDVICPRLSLQSLEH